MLLAWKSLARAVILAVGVALPSIYAQVDEAGKGDTAYTVMKTATCPPGWEAVTDITECNYAAQELRLPRTNAMLTERDDWPRGCFWLESYGGWLYWDDDGDEGNPGAEYQAVCEKKAPLCKGVSCAAHGWCNLNTKGTCGCQNIYTGPRCGQMKSTKIGSQTIQMLPTPNCDPPLGPLVSEAHCNLAAKQLGLPDITAFVDNDTMSPAGCWWNTAWNLLTFNYQGAPKCKYNNISTICLVDPPPTGSPTAQPTPARPSGTDCASTSVVQAKCGGAGGMMPAWCDATCASYFLPWYDACGSKLSGDNSLHNFYEMCFEVSAETALSTGSGVH